MKIIDEKGGDEVDSGNFENKPSDQRQKYLQKKDGVWRFDGGVV